MAGVEFREGLFPVGKKYPCTAHYNALYTSSGIIHNCNISDTKVSAIHSHKINCSQGYVRCNTLQVGNSFITSDRGIENALRQYTFKVLFIDPSEILLNDYPNGFIGGTAGVWSKNLYICGKTCYHHTLIQTIGEFVASEGFDLVELYDGKLMDVGGIFFIR
jgi:hypothetical protein